jgi:DNA-binding response OmpR family regulator
MKAGRVLVVDDEYDIQQILAELLEDAGYRVLVAKNGLEALERLGEDRVDLIILDIMMPLMSGPEMVDTLRRQGSEMPPILMISAGSTGEETAQALGCEFLRKPFGIDDILERTQEMIRRDRG